MRRIRNMPPRYRLLLGASYIADGLGIWFLNRHLTLTSRTSLKLARWRSDQRAGR